MSLTGFVTPDVAEGAETTLRHVLEAGVTVINTASFYGAGENHKVIGERMHHAFAVSLCMLQMSWFLLHACMPTMHAEEANLQGPQCMGPCLLHACTPSQHTWTLLHVFTGRAIEEVSREKVKIATKWGPFVKPDGSGLGQDFSRAGCRAQCQQSLKSLGVEYLDLYIARGPCNGPSVLEEAITAMKVRACQVRLLAWVLFQGNWKSGRHAQHVLSG